MRKILVVLLMFSSTAYGNQDWFCKRESSQVKQDTVFACGIAISRTEGKARQVALQYAQQEFTDICSLSEHCKGRKFDVIPTRTDCVSISTGFKCYRMVQFNLLPEAT